MFPPESETRSETPAERDRRRARTGVDRRGLKQVAVAFSVLFGGMAALYAADVAGVERRLTTATVVGLADRGTPRRTHECAIELATGYGYARIYAPNACRYAPWRIGDTAEVEARQLRFTKAIVVSTHGTIFDGAHGFLPES